jgi:hypothetical protein
MRLPNLIVAGAPKCGTSSLFNWLVDHPEVCGSRPKEPYYFMDENTPLFHSEANYQDFGLERYASFFKHCSSSAKILLEATPHYLYQETALNFFAACLPQPSIVFLLRKPSRQIFSLFGFLQNNETLVDKELSFAHFTDLLLEGKVERLEDYCYSKRSFFLLKNALFYARYYDFLARWIERFPSHQIRIILFEQMIADPQATLHSLASDLGIAPDFYDRYDFPKDNQTVGREIKNRFIHRKAVTIASYLPTSDFKGTLREFYLKVQTKNTTAPSPNCESLRRLEDYFVPYNRQLAQAFNLNLNCWR